MRRPTSMVSRGLHAYGGGAYALRSRPAVGWTHEDWPQWLDSIKWPIVKNFSFVPDFSP